MRSWHLPAAIVAVFAAAVLLVDPRGNFPLNDDWNFALATWWFSDHGVFRFARATAMSLRAQVLWGAIWTKVFGQSFEVLRASTLVLSLGTSLLMLRLLREAGVAALPRLLVAAALLFHPIFFWSSFTYMTEVPFVAASLLAFYLFARSYITKSVTFVALGGIAVLLSCFVRQTGIANAIPPIVLLLLLRGKWGARWRSALAVACAPLAVFGVLFLSTDLLIGYPEEVAMHTEAWRDGTTAITSRALFFLARRFSENTQYAALFFLPLVIPLFRWLGRNRTRWLLWLSCVVVVAPVASSQIALREPMPYRTFGNVFVNLGLGPLTLRDTWAFGYRHPEHLGFSARTALTIVAVATGALLLALLLAAAIRLRGSSVPVADAVAAMAAIHCLVSTATLAVSPYYFDRYALDSMWSFAIVAALTLDWPRWRTVTTATLLGAMALASSSLTADYLAWNRARWEGWRWLRDRGVSLRQMDGGYEINQYLIGGFDGVANIGKFQFSVIDDAYVITFNEVRGYRTIHKVPIERRLRSDGTLYVQERTTGFTQRFDLDDADD
ncbi:MAG: hypothetical protein ACYC7A_08320 [Thermoanaerobaculia bacterium]